MNIPCCKEWNFAVAHSEKLSTSCASNKLDNLLPNWEKVPLPFVQNDEQIREELCTKISILRSANNWLNVNPCLQCAKQKSFSTCQSTCRLCWRLEFSHCSLRWSNQGLILAFECSIPEIKWRKKFVKLKDHHFLSHFLTDFNSIFFGCSVWSCKAQLWNHNSWFHLQLSLIKTKNI